MEYSKILCVLFLFLLNGCDTSNINGGSFKMTPEQIAEQQQNNKQYEEQLKSEKQEEVAEYTKKAKALISQRCILFGWNKGTSEYVSCNKARFNVYEGEALFEYGGSYKRAYDNMQKQYTNDESTCIEYGVKKGTREFNKCQVKLEQDAMAIKLQTLKAEKERIREKLSRPTIYPSSTHCTTRILPSTGMIYTDCN